MKGELDEFVESYMKIFHVIFERLEQHRMVLHKLSEQDENLLKVIAGLHDIDLEEIRGSVQTPIKEGA